MDKRLQELCRLSGHRTWPDKDVSIAAMVEHKQELAQRGQRTFGAIAETWLQCVPPGIATKAKIQSFNRGVLVIAATTASAKFQLDRLLREGLESKIRAHFRGSIRSVSVRVIASI